MLPPATIKLLGNMFSSAMRAILLWCRIANIPTEVEKTQLPKLDGGFVDADPILTSPQADDGKIQTDQFYTLLRYLVSLRPKNEQKWYTADTIMRSKVDSYLEWHFNTLRQRSTTYLRLTTLNYCRNSNKVPPNDEIEDAMGKYLEALVQIEQKYLERNDFIAGPVISLADIIAATEIMFYKILDVSLEAAYPKLWLWYKRVQEQLPFWAEVHADFDETATVINNAQKAYHIQEMKRSKQKTDAGGGAKAPDVNHTVRFHHTTPAEVYAMLTDSDKLAAVTKSKCFINKTIGGEVICYDGSTSGTFLYLEDKDAGKKIYMRWRCTDWPPYQYSVVRINIREVAEGGTELIMTQSDVPPDAMKGIDDMWNNKWWKPMDGVLIRNLNQFAFFANVSPHDIYELFLDSARLTKMCRSKCEISRTVGLSFELMDGLIQGKNLQLVIDTKITQKWRKNDWPSGFFSHLTIELSRVAGGTDLKLTQLDVPVDKFISTVQTWEKMYFKKMKKYEFPVISSGSVLPDRGARSSTLLPSNPLAAASSSGSGSASSRASLGGSTVTSKSGARVIAVGPAAGKQVKSPDVPKSGSTNLARDQ